MWPFAKKRPVVASEPQKKSPPATSSLPTDAQRISEMLPVVFQRKHTDIRPIGCAGLAAGMDSADDWTSPLPDVYSVQGNIPASVFGWFASQSFIGHQLCAILAQQWLVGKACAQPPKDAAQNGYRVLPGLGTQKVPTEVLPEIERLDRGYKVLENCREAVRNSRIFGIRHVLFLVDGLDYEAPFNPDGVACGSYRGISQIDPYWISPEFDEGAVTNPSDPHFFEPTWWRLPGGRRVHRSHFIILREEEVADVLKPTYLYGGVPLPQQIFERVYAAERTANEAPELALTKRLTTMQGSIENYLADENEVTERLNAFNRLRSNHGFLIVGEDETISQTDTALADFDALIMTQYQLVAAIARMPATKLLGTSPKGFNATGEYEADNYDQELASIQETALRPIIERHHLLLSRSAFADVPGLVIDHAWNPIRKEKPGEKADNELKRAQSSGMRVQAGVTSPDEERQRLANDPDGEFSGLAVAGDPQDEDDLPGDLLGGDTP